ncbi:transcriptional regulator [Glycomyces algeriensis]|uniref:Transcriptional regulator n=2 Tax=Glycomyces algeriensis TaxID=256037 RepID=A0A9W6LIL9_9ACTN|nr:GntR family transcriptional regulator [Glycomyces algeriensis]GLI44743.1 transcriptional regulator [Glycomyces algeriensis]
MLASEVKEMNEEVPQAAETTTEAVEQDLPPRRVMANKLRADILNGELPPGSPLPSQRELAEKYGVARNTAAEAVKILESEGLIESRNRARPKVRERRRLLRLGAERYSNRLRNETGLSPFRAEVEKQGKTARVNCTSIERVPAPEEIAERLDLPADDDTVVRRENWYFADDEPVQVGITYIPWAIAEGTVLADSPNMGKGSLYGRFEDRGHRITWIREEIGSRMPTPEETKGLAIPAGVPVIDVIHTGIDQDEKPFEVTTFTMRADLNGLDYRIRIED